MTEADWVSCMEIEPLLGEIWDQHPGIEWNDRKPTLLMAACCKSVTRVLPPEFGEWVELLKQSADDSTYGSECGARFQKLDAYAERNENLSNLLFYIGYGDLLMASDAMGELLAAAAGKSYISEEFVEEQSIRHCNLIRDVFGNPFQPSDLTDAYRTPQVTALAKTIYEQEHFERAIELAIALQSAGCPDPRLVNHLQDEPVHVRGCWALDLILKKSFFGPRK